MRGVKGILSYLLMLFSASSVFAGSNIMILTGEIEFTAKDDFLSGVAVKGLNGG